MKLAILLPGYLDSPDYTHMKVFSRKLRELGYATEVLDPCGLWKTNNVNNYTITNYLKDIKTVLDSSKDKKPEEIILVGHSLGGFVSIIAGNLYSEVTKIVALCPPASIKDRGKKWENKPFRRSQRDLPENPSLFRYFDIPLSYVEDSKKYSAIDAVKKISKPLMIFIGMTDTEVPPEETKPLVANAINPYVVKMQNIGHNFRNSETECNLVMEEIQKFLTISK